MSAVGTIVSAGYGFICGAYMPISQFGEGLRNLLSLLPGTYGTALIRNHAMSGALNELSKLGLPAEFTTQIRDSIDCNLYFFNDRVSIPAMYTVLAGSCAVLISRLYINELYPAKKVCSVKAKERLYLTYKFIKYIIYPLYSEVTYVQGFTIPV